MWLNMAEKHGENGSVGSGKSICQGHDKTGPSPPLFWESILTPPLLSAARA